MTAATANAAAVETMTALVFTAPSTVELQQVPVPVAGPDEVIVEVAASGICGSELHGIRHVGFRKPPLVMGHEFAGTTPDGRRVTVNPLISCGACDACGRGENHLCRSREILGIHRPGAFAQRVAVPVSAIRELPESMDLTTAAMIEPLANAVHAVRLADPRPGARIAVLGAGTIGLVTLLVAQQYGEVSVSDLAEERLATARALGASHTATRLSGEFDVVIDAVGAAPTHAASIDLLRPGGTAVWIGLLSSEAGFDGQEIVRSEKRVIGSYCYRPSDFDRAVELAGSVQLDWTTSFSLDQGVEVFEDLLGGRHDVIKAVLHP
ncbi:alcohol dehydrogenase catalytic domain-containing protein [Nocardioides sp.]|uniref:alcohol dehydrogenase catalytic domain-containing protein n=1 Tax=Nocardioides sp. TaxID=35761 RepID=UPI0039E242C7